MEEQIENKSRNFNSHKSVSLKYAEKNQAWTYFNSKTNN